MHGRVLADIIGTLSLKSQLKASSNGLRLFLVTFLRTSTEFSVLTMESGILCSHPRVLVQVESPYRVHADGLT